MDTANSILHWTAHFFEAQVNKTEARPMANARGRDEGRNFGLETLKSLLATSPRFSAGIRDFC